MPRIGGFVAGIYREESASQCNLTEALCDASVEFAPISLDMEGVRDGKPYRYASLSAIRRATKPALAKHGIFLNHVYSTHEGNEYLVSVLRHKTGEYQSSTQVVPYREDMQDQEGVKTMLIKAAEKGLLSIIIEEEPAASATKGVSAEQRQQWESSLALAVKAISTAETLDTLDRYEAMARQRVTEGLLSPDAAGVIAARVLARANELRALTEKANVDSAGTSGNQVADAAGSGSGASDRNGAKAAGVGRGHVRSGERRSSAPA